MIFNFNTTVSELESGNVDTITTLASDLLHADINGYHLIIMSRAVSRWLLDSVDLSGREKARLNSIHSKSSTRNGILSEASTFVEIVFKAQEVGVVGNKFVIGVDAILRGRYLKQPARLIVENANTDGDFYKSLMRVLSYSSSDFSVSMDVYNGGGGTTSDMFKLNVNEGFVSVCIVDSDKSHEGSKLGDTAGSVLKVNETCSNNIGCVHVLRVRETENLIPYDIISSISCYKSEVFKKECDKYFLRKDSQFSSQWLYFDIKKGAVGKDFSKFGRCSKSKATWSEFFGLNEDACDDFILTGFGDGVLKNFLKCGRSQSLFRRAVISKDWNDHLGHDLQKLAWFFCGPRVMRI